MPIYETLPTRPVTRIPLLWSRPEWEGPWRYDRVHRSWYRFTTGGTIYHLDTETGDIRSF